MPKYRLGRNRPSAVRLAALPRYGTIAPQLPEPPAAIGPTLLIGDGEWDVLGNDTAGDCTIAAALHLQMMWSAVTTGTPLRFAAGQAIALYSQLSGYDPATGANDNGLDETAVLDYWSASGIVGDKLTAFAAIDPQNLTHLRQAIWCFGGVYAGLTFPRSAMDQFDAGQPWSVPAFSPIDGGHAVPAVGYDTNYLYVVTWGRLQPVEWSFVTRYFDAAYAPLDPLWIGPSGATPGGLDAAALTADLAAVAN